MYTIAIAVFITLSASFQTATPAPAASPRDACNFPPEVTRVAPTYVSQSFANSFPGVRQAVVTVTIDATGRVIDAKLKQSVSEPFMNRGAIEAAMNSNYAPGASDCKPVGGTLDVTIVFQRGGYECDREADVKSQYPAQVPAAAYAGQAVGTEKTAIVQVTIGADGKLASAKIYQSTGNDVMDAAALLSAQRSTFIPKMVRCRGVPSEALFKVSFFRNQ